MILDTDIHSFTQAHRLYSSVGMREYRREIVLEEEIRSGREARRMTFVCQSEEKRCGLPMHMLEFMRSKSGEVPERPIGLAC